MLLMLPDTLSAPARITITSQKFGGFVILVRQPSYGEILEDEARGLFAYTDDDKPAAYRERYLARLDLVVDWEDVKTKNERDEIVDVPYTRTALINLIRRDRTIARQINDALNAAYNCEEIQRAEGEPNAPPNTSSPPNPPESIPHNSQQSTPTSNVSEPFPLAAYSA